MSSITVLTQARREQLRVEVGEKLLALCVELAHSCNDVARRAHTHDLHDCLEDEQRQVGEIRVRAVFVLEDAEHAIAAVVVVLRGHGDEFT